MLVQNVFTWEAKIILKNNCFLRKQLKTTYVSIVVIKDASLLVLSNFPHFTASQCGVEILWTILPSYFFSLISVYFSILC